MDLFRKLSLTHLIRFLLESLSKTEKKKLYPVIISYLNIHETPSLLNDYLEDLTGKKSGYGICQDNETLSFWNNWYKSHKDYSIEYLQNCMRLRVVHSIIFDDLSEEELIKLSRNTDEVIRFAVSRRREIPNKILESLSYDENDTIRFEISRNKNTKSYILDILSRDKNSIIRRWVAAHSNINSAIIERLSEDKRTEVRGFLIRNPFVTSDILKKIHSFESDLKLKEEIENKLNSA